MRLIAFIFCFCLGNQLLWAQHKAIVINLNSGDTARLDLNQTIYYALKSQKGSFSGKIKALNIKEFLMDDNKIISIDDFKWINLNKPSKYRDLSKIYQSLYLAGGATLASGAYTYQIIEDKPIGIMIGSIGAAAFLTGVIMYFIESHPDYNFQKQHLLKIIPETK